MSTGQSLWHFIFSFVPAPEKGCTGLIVLLKSWKETILLGVLGVACLGTSAHGNVAAKCSKRKQRSLRTNSALYSVQFLLLFFFFKGVGLFWQITSFSWGLCQPQQITWSPRLKYQALYLISISLQGYTWMEATETHNVRPSIYGQNEQQQPYTNVGHMNECSPSWVSRLEMDDEGTD